MRLGRGQGRRAVAAPVRLSQVDIMKKFILVLVGFFMACTAYASFPASSPSGTASASSTSGTLCSTAPCYQWSNGLTPPTYFNSVEGAARASNAIASGYTFQWCEYTTFPNNVCRFQRPNETLYDTGFSPSGRDPDPAYVCPANSTLSGTSCTCNSGFDQSGSSCVPHSNVCSAKAGKPGITNWTVGYSRTPGASDLNMVGTVNKIPADKMVCDGGCVVEMTTGKTVWQSQTPTDQGLYRWSLDVVSVPTGAECTMSAADAPANKDTPNPQCPGYVGEVNGVKGCYGTASKPVTVTQADRPTSNPEPGNPAAGEKPLTGEGSGSTGAGRTPVAGTGGAAGGPASSAINSSGNGTVDKPPTDKEQQACGAPGQPRCSIDETGTPDGTGLLPTTQFDSKLQERENALTTVTSSSGKDTSWGVMPQWTQGGTCSPWHMFTLPPAVGNFSVDVDVCGFKPFADGIANFIWIALAFMGITSMVFATMTSRGS